MIEKNPMFWTPKNPAELAARLESFSGSEKAISYMVAMWTTNLCSDMWQAADPVIVPEDDAAARKLLKELINYYLDPDEVAQFRKEARENHRAGDDIKALLNYHPVYRDECAIIDKEAQQACIESTTLFRDLDPAEVAEFRQAARENHDAGDEIKTIWHPVYRDECAKIDDEARVIGSID